MGTIYQDRDCNGTSFWEKITSLGHFELDMPQVCPGEEPQHVIEYIVLELRSRLWIHSCVERTVETTDVEAKALANCKPRRKGLGLKAWGEALLRQEKQNGAYLFCTCLLSLIR